MTITKFFVCILYFSINLSNYSYLDIAKLGHEQYQDIVINGKVVQKATHNHNDCETRFQIINNFLKKYNRPFTMIDLGASQGYYTFKSAAIYPQSVFVMLEGDNPSYPLVGTQLFDLCKCNTTAKNIIYLNKPIIISDIEKLTEHEYFDIVLALNIIHWFENSWQILTDLLLSLGANIIIETPPTETINGES